MQNLIQADAEPLKHRETIERIIGLFYEVYNELGHGFLESVYENSLAIALLAAGFKVDRQIPIPVWFRGQKVGDFKADVIVNGIVLLELKAAKTIDRTFEKQLLNYLRATEIEVGLLLNFGETPEFRRFVFGNSRKKIREYPRESAAKSGT
jgi:GxxExxY protein